MTVKGLAESLGMLKHGLESIARAGFDGIAPGPNEDHAWQRGFGHWFGGHWNDTVFFFQNGVFTVLVGHMCFECDSGVWMRDGLGSKPGEFHQGHIRTIGKGVDKRRVKILGDPKIHQSQAVGFKLWCFDFDLLAQERL